MKKILLVAIAIVSLASCQKYDCTCVTDTFDSTGYYFNTSSATYPMKSTRKIKAIDECNTYETETANSATYCNLD